VAAVHAFLITDIVGSTRATRADAGAMQVLLEEHDDALASAVASSHGRIFKHTGDGICAVFEDPGRAISAAVEAQRSLRRLGADVRMGIDVGVAHPRGDDYFGLPLNRCARVMGLAHGGQILVTRATHELVRDDLPAEFSLRDLGWVRLRGFDDDDWLFQVLAPGLAEEFPPLSPAHASFTSLPVALSSFVGRDAEIAEISSVVTEERMVTLTGTGGVGKTRLALQVAGAMADRFRAACGGSISPPPIRSSPSSPP